MMNFFRALTILVILLFTTDSQIQLFSQTSKERPNVIIIYTDDNFDGIAGCKDLVTPAHDKLNTEFGLRRCIPHLQFVQHLEHAHGTFPSPRRGTRQCILPPWQVGNAKGGNHHR